MKNKILLISDHYRKYGLLVTLSVIINTLMRRIGLLDQVHLTKQKIILDGNELFGNIVAHGYFSGMSLPKEVWWTENDRFIKLLGFYEEHVIKKLAELGKQYKHFIDIGGADGYFAVGVLHGKLFERCTCFEISPKGREVIYKNAKLNNVLQKITIEQEGNRETIKSIVSTHGPSVVLCDIEGAEFDLFDECLLNTLSDSTIIIELHDDVMSCASNARSDLIMRAKEKFDVTYLPRQTPNMNNIPEITNWSDIKRYLALDECRPRKMDWLLLSPRINPNGRQVESR